MTKYDEQDRLREDRSSLQTPKSIDVHSRNAMARNLPVIQSLQITTLIGNADLLNAGAASAPGVGVGVGVGVGSTV